MYTSTFIICIFFSIMIHLKTSQYFLNFQCGKAFSQLSALTKHHRNVHEGLRNKVCNFCGKSFKESHHLKNHIKGVHEGLKFKKTNPVPPLS